MTTKPLPPGHYALKRPVKVKASESVTLAQVLAANTFKCKFGRGGRRHRKARANR